MFWKPNEHFCTEEPNMDLSPFPEHGVVRQLSLVLRSLRKQSCFSNCVPHKFDGRIDTSCAIRLSWTGLVLT